ncbi:hypothetical protein MB14_09960 [Roseivirga ehrenbergii]|uniref:Uncharacterized protein n=1 Tax=Roseivirga ehrenbergii (strain DSM 102268 / JCM 13514 / KCTC 12282 / NCIMB 14502 / KMM 6017) TaxID=279360 RepID=A0A150WYT4_ROSEK|nr:hypothetical protein MB14_09960 [Roseivirga ehrenbergii]
MITILLFTIGCSAPKKEVPQKKVEDVEPAPRVPIASVNSSIPKYKFSFSSLELGMPISELDQRVFKHYGEFYTKDFSVYQLDQIDYLAEAHYISNIDLIFIDSLLVQIQAFLTVDKSNDLINQFGRAKLLINDHHNKTLLETERAITKTSKGYSINEKLDQFRLKWVRQDADIEYEVNKKLNTDSTSVNMVRFSSMGNPNGFKYKLTFQTTDFQYQMALIEWESTR